MKPALPAALLALILLGFVSQAQAEQGKSTPVTRSNISNNRTCEPGMSGEDCTAESGMPTGKRQHGEVKIVKELDKGTAPVEAGNVTSPRDAASGQASGRRVATGDVDGDGMSGEAAVTSPRDAASGQASGKRVAAGDVNGDGTAEATAQPQEYKAKAGKTGKAK